MARGISNKPKPLVKATRIAPEVKELKNTNPMKKVLVANHTSGNIICPRSVAGIKGSIHRISLPSLVFPSGTAVRVDAEIWEEMKSSNNMVQTYLDYGLLKEVQQTKGIVATIGTTSDLTPPEHLQTPDELKNKAGSTRVEREVAGEITI